MILLDLLTRAYDILGDTQGDPGFFPRQRLVDLINEGCVRFRSKIEDAWFRANQKVVAGTAVYTVPDGCVRIRRVAFDDQTVPPKTILELVALDDKWTTRSSSEPIFWTSDAQSHDEYRYYETPSISTDGAIDFVADTEHTGSSVDWGTVADWDESGTLATFNADPANPSHVNADYGIWLSVTGSSSSGNFSIKTDYGVVVSWLMTFVKQTELWCVERPEPMTSDDDSVPIKAPYQLAPLWYALWHTYEQEEDHHNPVLSGYYRQLFGDELIRAQKLADNPTPYIIRVRGTSYGRDGASGLRFPNSVDFGSGAQEIVWGRRTRRW